MKQLTAIAFSLLLIVAQTFAVAAPMSGAVAVAKPSCCCEDCRCCVGESNAPSVPLVPSTAPVAAQNQFVLPPAAVVMFTLGVPADEFSPASTNAEFRAAALPLFQRNCVFLI